VERLPEPVAVDIYARQHLVARPADAVPQRVDLALGELPAQSVADRVEHFLWVRRVDVDDCSVEVE